MARLPFAAKYAAQKIPGVKQTRSSYESTGRELPFAAKYAAQKIPRVKQTRGTKQALRPDTQSPGRMEALNRRLASMK